MPAVEVMTDPALPVEPFSRITDDNYAGTIWIVSLLCLIYSLLSFVGRLWVKWGSIGIDDYTLIAAEVFAIAQFGALVSALNSGLGRTTESVLQSDREALSKAAFGGQILVVISLCLAKCSVILLMQRVFTRELKSFWHICNIMAGVATVWGFVALLLVSAGCNPKNYMPPTQNDTCPSFEARWNAYLAFDVATEIIIASLPACFLWTLQMAFLLKVKVVIAFAFRLPVAAFSIVFVRLFTSVHRESNPGTAIATAISWQQVLIAYSLISGTIPCMKSFIRSFDTSFGMADGSSNAYSFSGANSNHSNHSQHSQSKTGSPYQNKKDTLNNVSPDQTVENIPMKPMNPIRYRSKHEALRMRDRRKDKAKDPEPNEPPVEEYDGPLEGPLRPEQLNTETTCAGPADVRRPESRESSNSKVGSQDMIIRRDVRFEISREKDA